MSCLPKARGATSLRTTHFRLSTVRYCVKHKHGDPGGLTEVRIEGQRRGAGMYGSSRAPSARRRRLAAVVPHQCRDVHELPSACSQYGGQCEAGPYGQHGVVEAVFAAQLGKPRFVNPVGVA